MWGWCSEWGPGTILNLVHNGHSGMGSEGGSPLTPVTIQRVQPGRSDSNQESGPPSHALRERGGLKTWHGGRLGPTWTLDVGEVMCFPPTPSVIYR